MGPRRSCRRGRGKAVDAPRLNRPGVTERERERARGLTEAQGGRVGRRAKRTPTAVRGAHPEESVAHNRMAPCQQRLLARHVDARSSEEAASPHAARPPAAAADGCNSSVASCLREQGWGRGWGVQPAPVKGVCYSSIRVGGSPRRVRERPGSGGGVPRRDTVDDVAPERLVRRQAPRAFLQSRVGLEAREETGRE